MADSMGSGQVESDPGKPIIHFGSPPGTKYIPKRKDKDDQQPDPTREPVPEPTTGRERRWRRRNER
jgi:hypothetical protein